MWNIDATMEKKTLDAPPKKPKNNKMNNIEKYSTEAAHYHIWVAQSTWHQTGNHTWSCFTNSQWGSRQSNMGGAER